MGVSLKVLSRHQSPKALSPAQWTKAILADPRHYQIGVLSSLILLGVFHFAFQLPWWHVLACVGSTLGTQAAADKVVGRQFDPRSPLISALSLTLLLRTGSVSLSIAAGVLAVASKYLIRWRWYCRLCSHYVVRLQ